MIALADGLDADVQRLRQEFVEMPGLVLTVAQAARLYGLPTAHAKTLLCTLESDGFLIGGSSGDYRRSTPPTCD